jgi:hypothetical protein
MSKQREEPECYFANDPAKLADQFEKGLEECSGHDFDEVNWSIGDPYIGEIKLIIKALRSYQP